LFGRRRPSRRYGRCSCSPDLGLIEEETVGRRAAAQQATTTAIRSRPVMAGSVSNTLL
jgi:hypothetical protein